jgi:hypothetical protein
MPIVTLDRILRGAKPAEQPTKFEMAVNLKTAKPLGLAVPQSILLRRRHDRIEFCECQLAALVANHP